MMRGGEKTLNQSLIHQQLKSSNPKQRYQAIKTIARAKDESMLSLLSRIAHDDPDEQVREVAAKAERYIKNDGSSPAAQAAEPEADSSHSKTKERAAGYVSDALTFQSNGQRDKALKALSKAVEIHPRIINDHFFVSVLDSTTGSHGEESLAMLQRTEIKKVRVSEQQLEREKRAKSHSDKTSRITWVTSVIDLMIYTCILVAGTMLAILVLGQSADGVITGYNAAVDNYSVATNAGDKNAKLPDPVDPVIWAQAEALRSIGLPTAAVAGGIVGIASVVGILVQLGITHVVARFVFKGQGTLPYLIYKVVSTYNAHLTIMFAIAIVGIIVTFSTGSPIVLTIAGGLISLISLKLSFQTLKKVAEAYNFGFLQGCLSVTISGFVVGAISFVVQLAFMASIMQLVMGSYAG